MGERRHRVRILLCLCLACIVAGCAGTRDQRAVQSCPQPIKAPVRQAGDTWRWQDEKGANWYRQYLRQTNTLGVLLHQQGAYSEAIAAFQEGLRREAGRTDVWYALGVTYVAQRDRVRAREIHVRLVQLDAAQAERFLDEEMRR